MTWRWPWVPRSRWADAETRAAKANTALHLAEANAGYWRHYHDEERRLYAELLEKYHALKLQGAVIPEPPPVVVPRVDAPVDPVKRAIRDQVRANPDMRGLDAYLTKYAAELRNVHNKKPEDIADLLSRWESSETMSAAVDSVVAVPRPAEDAA